MKLIEPIIIENLQLKNRMVMAPMRRSRANKDGVISELATE
jgi:2,4-dienoyl-CoA reductase-like NADH-dependent reductase (Old Yellow Enzyme family)